MREETLFSEKQLFEKINEESEWAFQVLFKRYYPRMLSFVGKVVKSPYVAEEIVQEVFIRLWENRYMLNEVKNPKDYLFIMVRNHALNYLRAAAREQSRREQLWEDLEKRAANIHATLEEQEAGQWLEKIVAKLSPQQQKVFRLSREQGLSHQEIANELHLSKNTVKKHVAESLKTFKLYLKESGLLLFSFL